MRMWTIAFLLPVASGLAAADDPPPAGSTDPKNGMSWVQPSPTPPVASTRPVRGQLAAHLRTPEAPSGDLAGLRAVSLREGNAVIALAGATRPIRPGDLIGSATLKAVGSDRIILERPAPIASAAAAGKGMAPAATIVVTFGPGGVARVRTYALPGSEAPPPEIR